MYIEILENIEMKESSRNNLKKIFKFFVIF